MKSKFNQIISKILSSFCLSVAIFGVNNACYLIYGQEKEPESLKKYKNIK